MKKLALSLLLSTAIITQEVKSVGTTTDLGPIQLITTNGSNVFASGTVKLNGNIEIGQSNSDSIILQGQYITNGVNTGQSNIITVLSVDSTGQLVSGPLTYLGSNSNNIITCPATSGDLTIQSANGGNVVLNSASHIKLVSSSDITNPTVSPVLISVDSSGHIVTSNKADLFAFGDKDSLNTSFITVDNSASNPSGIILNTANTSSSNITLNAGNNNINLTANGIVYPSSGMNVILMIDSNGNIKTVTDSTPVEFGSLIAAKDQAGEFIALGNSVGGNYFGFVNNISDISLQAGVLGSNLLLSANNNINLASLNLNATVNSAPAYTVLALDRSGNLVTSEKSEIFVYGNDTTNNNYVLIDNANIANGIKIGGSNVYLQGQGLAPAAGYTNILTIDENGKIGVMVSTGRLKENINPLDFDDAALESLAPVRYYYKENPYNLQYGFIAEELAKNPVLKNTVIYDKEGQAMSVNYNAVFVAVTDAFLKTKKALQSKINTLEENILHKDAELSKLTQLYLELEQTIKDILNKLS